MRFLQHRSLELESHSWSHCRLSNMTSPDTIDSKSGWNSENWDLWTVSIQLSCRCLNPNTFCARIASWNKEHINCWRNWGHKYCLPGFDDNSWLVGVRTLESVYRFIRKGKSLIGRLWNQGKGEEFPTMQRFRATKNKPDPGIELKAIKTQT